MVKTKTFDSMLSKLKDANNLLNEAKAFISNLSPQISEFDFKLLEKYVSELSKEKDSYSENFNALENSDTDVSNLFSSQKFATESRITIVRGELFLDKYRSTEVKTEKDLPQHPVSNNFYQSLPTLRLPTFSGIIEEYKPFIENFLSIVNSANLNAAQKLHYLRNCLKGEASSSISGLSAIDENFAIALDILNSRYDRPKLVIQAHVKNIFELDNVTKLSSSSLQTFVDNLNKNIMCLRNLKVTEQQLVSMLIMHIINKKLDSETREKLKTYKPSEILKIDEIIQFLQDRAQFLIDSGVAEQNKRVKHVSLVASSENSICNICKGAHKSYKCPDILNLSVEQRIQKIKELKLCKNCLSHSIYGRCSSKFRCSFCKGFHHSLLHLKNNASRISPQSDNTLKIDDENNSSTSNTSLTCYSNSSKNLTLLSTAEVLAKDFQGNFHTVRCLLDSGSMHSIVTARLLKKLNLPTVHTNISLIGINSKVTSISQQTKVHIASKTSNYASSINCLIMEKIATAIPIISFDKNVLKIPPNVQLADPNFNVSKEVDLLIGASHFYDLLNVGQISLGINSPILQSTKLGYIVTGKLNVDLSLPNSSNISVTNCCTSTSNLEFDLQNFWRLEDIKPENKMFLLSKSEQACESHFLQTVSRSDDGKFIVSIPFNSSINKLGVSYFLALKLFQSLERRLSRHPEIKQLYSEFISEYKQLGHLSQIPFKDVTSYNFLPHHEVLKSSSTTTKLRVVFNGSFKTDSGISLNSCQLLGPVVQRDLFAILLNFRKYLVAVTADCEKMYRQIWVTPEQRNYQCILWRDDPSLKLSILQLNTVTYGLASSSFLATRCLKQLGVQNLSAYPESASKILNDFYMDDFISGSNSSEEAKQLSQEVSSILTQAGFSLRKFISNDKSLFKNCAEPEKSLNSDSESRTLGIRWNSLSDCFRYSLSDAINNTTHSKRQLLSAISRIFDPLGLVSPLVIKGKLLIQAVWRLNLTWDEEIPISLLHDWESFKNGLAYAPKLNIPRHIIFHDALRIELHGFCDASTRAFGACIYIRCIFSNRITSNLLCSKSRVAPLKPVTLPRLELSAAVLLAELATKVINTLSFKFDKTYFWSDSKIVLSWLNSTPHRFKVFVANRIAFVLEHTNSSDWHHVSGEKNPADLITRGSFLENSEQHRLWFTGPSFILRNNLDLPVLHNSLESELPELKNNCTVLVANETCSTFSEELLNKFSSLSKLQRVTAYVLRFLKNCQITSEKRAFDNLSVEELNNSLNVLVKLCQSISFHDELKALSLPSPKNCKNNHINSLNPFIDDKGLIRVGGRIRRSNLCFDKVHPLLLPKGHNFTKLILRHYHISYLHCGANQLLAVVRNKFWPLSGRSTCRQIVKTCVDCFRYLPKFAEIKMGDLPNARISQYHPCFSHTGVDFAGPINIKDRYTRNPKYLKVYIALFVCMSTRAIHLELVTSLTSQAFIDTFKRFIARRGKPNSMFSDNAKNFVSSADELKQLHTFFQSSCLQSELSDFLTSKEINWYFIPPYSPHFGGIWESNIKSTKTHLFKVLKDSNLNYENLYTLITQIESVLNSRPLSPMSNDPNDYNPLTPFHFLLGCSFDALPAPPLNGIPVGRMNSIQRRQLLINHFWKRWSREVLPELQRRLKWQRNTNKELQVGDMVLLSEPNVPPYVWPLARVVALHPGADGHIRVVTIRTPKGNDYKRSITKLCPLPINY